MQNSQLRETTTLKDGSRVTVVGGGPAGAFFAIRLLRAAKQTRRNIAVTIIEKKGVRLPDRMPWRLKGCNFCAGVISPKLHELLSRNGIMLPPGLICQEFTHIWIHGQWKNFPLRIPPDQRMYAVFRGTLPPDRGDLTGGFDNFLLQKAGDEGAAIITGEVRDIRYTPSRKPLLTVKSPSGATNTVESDFVAVAAGVNPSPDSPLFRSCQRILPGFKPPRVRRALIFELKPGREYLKKYMDRELYLIESGSETLRLEHIALVPRGDHLTVALVGEAIDRAALPGETGRLVEAVLSLPQVRALLPRITPQNTPVACTCSPRMAVKPATAPFGDRIAMVGDALGARLYKDGLCSAFITAEALAETVIHRGTDPESLSAGYGPTAKWLERDNRYGERVFKAIRLAFAAPVVSRIIYQAFATEMKFRERDRRPLGDLLRKIGSGTADYHDIFRDLTRGPVLRSVLTGAYKTARNILTEVFFGISWETYGRYPTVILKEKRDYFKKSIVVPLGTEPEAAPEMERMYAIKIRASAGAIFEELGKFGDAEGKFLRLRFVDVRRTRGLPNQVGTVVTYRLRMLPVSMDIRLARCIPGKTLLYEPGELFAERGKLIFDISPTKDGNNRLVIYTAFDFKRGRGILSRIFWTLFKKLFPEYAHDVVWNHAICCIKGEAEKNAERGFGGNRSPAPPQSG
ncbi:hypothetical protein DENIS_3120 [Desulfonema ishimotonii]|uniref:Uncharacterized protein n=1 Tax=Desulfonema ishimotonii TaxID=45657 RepID=A0A401FYY0_9BACT|nr:hypothetical protein [Desulfonema ishimotonii]GBC62157.1 hypothetical protein DENIS_3120 [Desulfonema ishimotonii]